MSEAISINAASILSLLHTNMTTQFRDTQFGHLVRFLSGTKLFRYPDEIDPSLWKKSLQRDRTSTSTPSGERSRSLEKSKDPNNSTTACAKDCNTRDADLQDWNINRLVEDGTDVYRVDWYGPNDPEVCICPFWFYATNNSHTEFRIPKIGPAAGSCWSASKYASSTFQSTSVVPSMFPVNQVSWQILLLARL